MRFVWALIIGAIYPLGFAPFDFWPLTLVSVFGLMWLMAHEKRSYAWLVWWFAAGKYVVGASWIYVSINQFGGAPLPLAGLLVGLFVMILAFFHWPAGWAYGRLRSGSPYDALTLAFLLVATEWLTTWLLTGFPWLFVGHAMISSPLGGFLPVIGSLGTSLLGVFSVAFVYIALRRNAWRHAVFASVPWLAGFAAGTIVWTEETSTHSVALVQGNLSQARKWLPEERLPNLRTHLDLTRDHWDADVVVWPEAAITMPAGSAAEALQHIGEKARQTRTNVVLGIPSLERFPDGGYEFKNSAVGLGLARGRFSKHHLVPFGEFVPFEGMLRGLIEFFDLPMSSTTPGARDQPNLRLNLNDSITEAAMAICYEVAYAESLRRHAATAGVLLTISNDTWFGASIGPLQHMQIAQVRARENGRWLLRATNNGVTGVVNPRGDVVAQLPQFEAGTLRGQFSITNGRTPYNRWGDWPVLLTLIGGLIVVVSRQELRPLIGRKSSG